MRKRAKERGNRLAIFQRSYSSAFAVMLAFRPAAGAEAWTVRVEEPTGLYPADQ